MLAAVYIDCMNFRAQMPALLCVATSACGYKYWIPNFILHAYMSAESKYVDKYAYTSFTRHILFPYAIYN